MQENDPQYTQQPQLMLYFGKTYLTYISISINIIVWVTMVLVGKVMGWSTNEQLLYFGSKVNALIATGEFWRLITPMVLHVDLMHLAFNCYAIWIYGKFVEQLYGTVKATIIYFIAGVVGCVVSYILSQNPSAGASGAIFGLIGALLYLREKRADVFRRVFGTSLFVIIGINLFLGASQSGIDNWGHIGGLIGGFFAAHAVGLYKDFKLDKIKIGAFLLIVVIVLGGIVYGNQKYKSVALANKAEEYLEEGKIGLAYETIQDAYLNDSKDNNVSIVSEQVYVSIINDALANSNYDLAFKYMNELKLKYYDNINVLSYEAQLYNLTDQSEKALEKYTKLVTLYPNQGIIWLEKGRIEIKLQLFTEARSSLETAMELDAELKQECQILLASISSDE